MIYAQGKTVGSIINEHDIIMLYYLVGNQWVNLANTNVGCGSGPGTTRAPSNATYEEIGHTHWKCESNKHSYKLMF